jgi:hypothetical protein
VCLHASPPAARSLIVCRLYTAAACFQTPQPLHQLATLAASRWWSPRPLRPWHLPLPPPPASTPALMPPTPLPLLQTQPFKVLDHAALLVPCPRRLWLLLPPPPPWRAWGRRQQLLQRPPDKSCRCRCRCRCYCLHLGTLVDARCSKSARRLPRAQRVRGRAVMKVLVLLSLAR